MFTLDERIRGLPAAREQVISLFQSINLPHLAIPGKQAGPAQAFILGLRGQNGFNVLVYLFLSETLDCAVYTSPKRNVASEEYSDEEANAHAFVESMGFMMDNMNFRSLPAPDQEEMLKTLPVFLKDPKLARTGGGASAAAGGTQQRSVAVLLGRLFASF